MINIFKFPTLGSAKFVVERLSQMSLKAAYMPSGYIRVEDMTQEAKQIITESLGTPVNQISEETFRQKESVDNIKEASQTTNDILDAIEKAYKKGGMRGVIKGDEQVSDTTVDEVLRDMKPLFGYDMDYAIKKIKKFLKPQDYAKYVKESVEQIAEAFKSGDTVKVPHKGKMVRGKIIRYDDGGTGKARQSGGGYVVDVGEPASIFVPDHKVVKEEVEQIEEAYYSKAVATPLFVPAKFVYDEFFAKVRESGMMFNRLKAESALEYIYALMHNPKSPYSKYQGMDILHASALEHYSKIMGLRKEEVEVAEEWKSLKKTKVDLNALRKQGYKVSVQHGEGDTLYRVSKTKSNKPVKKEENDVEEATEATEKQATTSSKKTSPDYLKSFALETLKKVVEKYPNRFPKLAKMFGIKVKS